MFSCDHLVTITIRRKNVISCVFLSKYKLPAGKAGSSDIVVQLAKQFHADIVNGAVSLQVGRVRELVEKLQPLHVFSEGFLLSLTFGFVGGADPLRFEVGLLPNGHLPRFLLGFRHGVLLPCVHALGDQG